MTHRSVRLYLVSLLCLALVFATVKLAYLEDWHGLVIALSTSFGVILQWVVSKDDRPSVKKGKE